ncbi:uncharacterized protein HaLaN_26346 [Haematococcus lacustris]|uniref:Uncharacterized protein n=1 Tax=Haematococcus lacustris TaxID=44745 RepID=A0A6A0A680_HAELA|nr:uncharacterized protein HaLaN_26346 [Haematococcus lacustris]
MQAKQEMQGKVAAVAAVVTAAVREDAGGSTVGGHSWRDVPFNPWAVVYLDKASSVSRLRPEYRLLPLLPTQLGQAVYAGLVQCALLACLLLNPVVKTGIVGCAVLAAYSVGRILFFMLRDDEKFKSNRSYTTAYVALITIGLSAVTALYAQLASPHCSRFALTHLPSAEDCRSYAWVAAATSAINFLIQGLHHHEQVGRFPDLTALFGPPVPAMRAPGSKQQLWSSWGELPKCTKTKAS